MQKIGINTDGFKFGENADFYSGSDLWDKEERKVLRDGIEYIYGKFLNRVARGREQLDSLEVHSVGVGKVWSGKRALELKLVDKLGSLKDAISIAAEAAGLEEDYTVLEYPIQERKSMFDKNKNKSMLKIKLSGTLGEIQETLNSVPDFNNDPIQFVLPYRIIIN